MARTWTEITDVAPSVFGFAVAAHPHDPRTAWFVPAEKDEVRIPVGGRMVVTRTRDGGESFETLSTGLPQDHAYHLVYRHALDVDASGDRLAHGQHHGIGLGERRLRATAGAASAPSLPPVACVRWAG